MNFQQLNYIIAVDKLRSFSLAAEECFVTQATLSMMVKKLEEELGVKIFDRTKQPVVATEVGAKLIEQARIILKEHNKLIEIVKDEQAEISGELRVGIIPTLSPYLLPLFMQSFLENYPLVKLKIAEQTTEEIMHKLKKGELDAGLLAIPLNDVSLKEQTLFYEEFVVYAAHSHSLLRKKYLLVKDIDVNQLWLLEEGHCLRSQVINLCELKAKEKASHQFDFESGSIETLKKIVELNQGITILPKLALIDMTAKQKKNIRYFKKPAPVREIGLVTYRHFIKEKLLKALSSEILATIPPEMQMITQKTVVQL